MGSKHHQASGARRGELTVHARAGRWHARPLGAALREAHRGRLRFVAAAVACSDLARERALASPVVSEVGRALGAGGGSNLRVGGIGRRCDRFGRLAAGLVMAGRLGCPTATPREHPASDRQRASQTPLRGAMSKRTLVRRGSHSRVGRSTIRCEVDHARIVPVARLSRRLRERAGPHSSGPDPRRRTGAIAATGLRSACRVRLDLGAPARRWLGLL